jgi:ParB family chromosome partitioning protein
MQQRSVETSRVLRDLDQIVFGAERTRSEVIELPIREIMPNRVQPRTQIDPVTLDELAASIRQHGVREPILVRVIPLTVVEGVGCTYELIAGERRWRASLRAERPSIPAIMLPEQTSDQTVLELAITENLQREDLHPLDEAQALARMQQELGYSYAQIAERLGKSKGYVQNRMRLLHLAEPLRALIRERPATLGHVYELERLDDPQAQAALIRAVREEGLSRAETRARVQARQRSSAPPYFQKYDPLPATMSIVPDASTRQAAEEPPAPITTDPVYVQNDSHAETSAPGAPFLTETERMLLRQITRRLTDRCDPLDPDDHAVLQALADQLARHTWRASLAS